MYWTVLEKIFRDARYEALKNYEQRVAVCVCAPGRIVELCRKACAKYSDRYVSFDLHFEVFDFVRDSTKVCLKEFVDSQDIDARNIPDADQINYDHWVCSIKIKLDYGSISMKLHYRSNVARHVASVRFNIPAKEIADSTLRDMIQEYLNLVMGRIKSRYGSADVSVTVPAASTRVR